MPNGNGRNTNIDQALMEQDYSNFFVSPNASQPIHDANVGNFFTPNTSQASAVPHGIGDFFTPSVSQPTFSNVGAGLGDSYLTDTGTYSPEDIAAAQEKYPMPKPVNFNFGGGSGGSGGGGGYGTNSYDDIYDQLAQSTKELFENVTSKDFTSQIKELAEQGRIDIEDMSQEQLNFLQDSYDRRISQITQIGSDLTSELRILDSAGRAELDAISESALNRQREAAGAEGDRLSAARGELGEQVSSEFEEVAALTAGLRANTDESNAAAMDRLRTVSRMASQERLAQPAKLVAQAQLAVGDEKFRLQNQIKQATSDALRQLNANERQQVLDEAKRLAQQGYAQDMALAQSLQQIEAQRANTYIREEEQRRARAAAAAAAQNKAAAEAQQLANAAAILGIDPQVYAAMPASARNTLWDQQLNPEEVEVPETDYVAMTNAALLGMDVETYLMIDPTITGQRIAELTETPEAQGPALDSHAQIAEMWDNTVASHAMGLNELQKQKADAINLYGGDSDKVADIDNEIANSYTALGGSTSGMGIKVDAALKWLDAYQPYVPAQQGTYTAPIQGASVDGEFSPTTTTFNDPNSTLNPFATTQAQAGYTVTPSFALPPVAAPSGSQTAIDYLRALIASQSQQQINETVPQLNWQSFLK